MVDMSTLRQFTTDGQSSNRLKDELGPAIMRSDEPPGGDFVLLLPSTIMGFDMQDKRWSKLWRRQLM